MPQTRTGLVAPTFQSPPPTGYDPRGFAVGVLANREIQRQGLRLRQWRWKYGASHRERPFEPHRELRGRFMTLSGELDGWYPGDHKGCLCSVAPVYVVEGTRQVVPARFTNMEGGGGGD